MEDHRITRRVSVYWWYGGSGDEALARGAAKTTISPVTIFLTTSECTYISATTGLFSWFSHTAATNRKVRSILRPVLRAIVVLQTRSEVLSERALQCGCESYPQLRRISTRQTEKSKQSINSRSNLPTETTQTYDRSACRTFYLAGEGWGHWHRSVSQLSEISCVSIVYWHVWCNLGSVPLKLMKPHGSASRRLRSKMIDSHFSSTTSIENLSQSRQKNFLKVKQDGRPHGSSFHRAEK